MSLKRTGRRTFLKGAGIMVLTTTGVVRAAESLALQAVPNSSGTERPKLKAPAHAADCHIHIFDPQQFPPPAEGLGARTFANDTAQDYRLFQKRIGTSRVVIVTPRAYVTDNRCTVDAAAQFGPNGRGVAVLRPTVTDAELKELDKGGIRGIRFTIGSKGAVVSIDMLEPLAKRVADLGWHVQLYMRAEQIVENADLLRRLPTPIVFDHLGSLGDPHTAPPGLENPGYGVIRGLIDKGRTWVKLSGPGLNSKVGPPTYADAVAIAQAYVKAAPERLVWGSNWPHPGQTPPPDDAVLFDLLAEYAPDQAVRNRILVTNPEALYGFPKSA
jgi:D-galactarolactone isomerase